MARVFNWKTFLFLAGVAGYAGYRARRQIIARALNLSPPEHDVELKTDVAVTMHDGISLIHDHHAPIDAPDAPTILIRSPYGRNMSGSAFGLLLAFFAERFAERGYHVILQDVRGRFDSGGTFRPYWQEQDDAIATVEWMREQPWFNGTLALWGASYLGIVQWLLVNKVPEVKAIMPLVAATNLRNVLLHDEALDYNLIMRWLVIFSVLDEHRTAPLLNALQQIPVIEGRTARACGSFPILQGDVAATGKTVDFYQEWLTYEDDAISIWPEGEAMITVPDTQVPVYLVAGWHDFFMREQLNDYVALRDAGQQPRLTIGPWAHFDQANAMIPGIQEGLAFFDSHLKRKPAKLSALPVRLYIMGANEWREYPDFPPPSQQTAYYLQPGHRLSITQAQRDESLTYRYDPNDPTPSLGGAMFAFAPAVRDNRSLESRPDVLVFTSEPLQKDIEIIGYVHLQLYVASSTQFTDFYGRLCDVQSDGRSLNVCDGLFRVKPGTGTPQPDGTLCIEVDMWATAYHFKRGHQLRLQVSSGAHPRWLRNSGTGEFLVNEKELVAADQTVHFGKSHPSALILPVV